MARTVVDLTREETGDTETLEVRLKNVRKRERKMDTLEKDLAEHKVNAKNQRSLARTLIASNRTMAKRLRAQWEDDEKELKSKIETLEEMLGERKAKIAKLEEDHQNKDQEIVSLKTAAAKDVEKLKKTIAERDEKISDLEKDNEKKDSEILYLQERHENTEMILIEQMKDSGAQIAKLSGELDGYKEFELDRKRRQFLETASPRTAIDIIETVYKQFLKVISKSSSAD